MKHVTSLLLFLLSSTSYSATMYQCSSKDGTTSFQDTPCKGETIKVSEIEPNFKNENFKNEMIKILAKMTGKTESQLSDPKIRQAAEALAATDAAKSYAYTKIYGVSKKYCDSEVKAALENYNSTASDIIKLGNYYYNNGIHINIGNKNIDVSAIELTKSLNKMLLTLNNEYKSAKGNQLNQKCKEAYKALSSLTVLYGSK